MSNKAPLLNSKAWNILVDDEKTALGLQFAMDKSSWAAGEIMSKSHYKYLEIKYRAEKFLKLFTEHFEIYDEIVLSDIGRDKEVLTYFNVCITKRMKPLEAIYEACVSKDKIPGKTAFNLRIVKELEYLEKSGSAHELTLFNLVKEFDRWNNFRILPKEVQEPSAFKRRVKNAYRKHIKVLTSLSPLSIEVIIKRYKTKKPPNFYLPLLVKNLPEVIKIKANKETYETFKSLSLYLFEKEEDAQAYISDVFNYLAKGNRSCTDGLEFWPTYREHIKKAHNYQAIQKISPSRKYLELAMNKLQFL